MAIQEWVEKHVLAILKKKTNEHSKAIQLKLIANYNIKIPYHTTLRGKERALKTLYEYWEKIFSRLYNFKAEIKKQGL
jgi:hypothetical protein